VTPRSRPAADRLRTYWIERDMHPGAWWLWAIGLATAASRTTNPVLLLILIAGVCTVVVCRRGDAPWARAFRLYLWLAALIVAFRVGFRVVFGGGEGSTVLVRLPEIPLPDWAAGVQLFGAVSAEAVLGGLYDGLRLAAMVVCIGAANALANPKRLLKAMPGALYETGTVVVVAMSVFPQLAESVLRVRAARRLRGEIGRGPRALKSIVIPVLEDALERSLLLAAAMDSRGYGRSGRVAPGVRLLTGTLTITGLLGLCVGIYATLDGSAPRHLQVPLLVGGALVAGIGFVLTGRRVHTTRYRPDRWQAAELITVGCGVGVAAGFWLTARVDPASLNPSLSDLTWPQLPLPGVLALVVCVLPALLTPPPAVETPDRHEVVAQRHEVSA